MAGHVQSGGNLLSATAGCKLIHSLDVNCIHKSGSKDSRTKRTLGKRFVNGVESKTVSKVISKA